MNSPAAVRHHFRACNLCEAICGIDIVMDGEAIQAIRGDNDDQFSRGHICPKAVALQDIHDDPDRLRHPLRRTADGWKRIGWDEAFDEVASRLKGIRSRHGRDAIGTYLGNPTVHNYGSALFLGPLLATVGTRNRFSASSLDQLPHHFAAATMFGHPLLVPVPDIDRTNFFVIMGGNPAVSNGSLMTAPDVKNRLKAVQDRGGRVVVIDPRRTETAKLADQHVFIRPGTDAVLLLAILHTLHDEGLAHPGRLEPHLNGLEALWQIVGEFTAESAGPVAGIDAPVIRDLARAFARADGAVWYGRVGVCTQEFGALALWLIYVTNIVTGNLDRPGGAMFAKPAVDPVNLRTARYEGFARWHSRVRKLPEFYGELPASVMAEEMLTPGDGRIRALVTSAGNPVLSSPNGRQLDEALGALDFMVSIDIYLNETTRHAHIILPPTVGLEHENYDLGYLLFTVRNTARFSPALFTADKGARHDWEILLELETRLRTRGPVSGVLAKLRRGVLRWLGPEGMLDLGLRFGPYGAGWKVWKKGLTLRRLKRSPHGIDLGPLEPCLPDRLKSRSKQIDMVPAPLRDDLQRLRARFRQGESTAQSSNGEALRLIGRRDLRSNNSWMHNSERLVRGKPRCTLLMHPADAARLGIEDHRRVRVRSRVGVIEAEVEVTDDIMPGVVSLPHGWGHTRDGTQMRVAERIAGVSVNDITDEQSVDALSGNAAFNGTPVLVEAVGA